MIRGTRNKKFFRLFVTFIAMYTTLSFNIQPVLADTTEDYASVVKNAPVGLDISKYFDVGKYAMPSGFSSDDIPFQTNSANIFTSTTDTAHSGRVLNIAKGGNVGQVGAAWSNTDKGIDNYFDINKKQTVSVWLYFGSGESIDQTVNGEGMSLVLQNDDRGTSAMGAGLQGNGVMGFDDSRVKVNGTQAFFNWTWSKDPTGTETLNTPDQAAKTAVGNSISLNFDSQDNTLMGQKLQDPSYLRTIKESKTSILGTGLGTRYDQYTLNSFSTPHTNTNLPTNYPEYNNLIGRTDLGSQPLKLGNTGSTYGLINLTYPGNPVSYQALNLSDIPGDNKLGSTFDSSNPWSYINGMDKGQALSTYQVGTKPAYLIDGADVNKNPIYWHHLTFTWNPASGNNPATITYHYNDKYPDGTVNTGQSSNYNPVTETIPVDPAQFGNPSNGRVYWGLTGANSNNSSVYSKLAVFESIPALATANVKTTLTDNSLKKTINDDSTDITVNNGNDLNFDYNLAWDPTSRQDWKAITADMNLPSDVTYKSATITYHGSNGDSTPITISDAKGMSGTDLSYKLTHDLGTISSSSNYTSADIVLNGTATNGTGSEITVSPAPATFDGSNALESSSTPKFKIEGNTVVTSSLDFSVSPSLAFKDINYKARTKYIERKTPFDLSVTSLNEPWTLSVSAADLNNGSSNFDGNIVYKKNDTATPVILDSSDKVVEQDKKAYDTSTTDNISKTWTQNSGLLLEPAADSVNQSGKYNGKLTWSITNSI